MTEKEFFRLVTIIVCAASLTILIFNITDVIEEYMMAKEGYHQMIQREGLTEYKIWVKNAKE